MDNNIYEVTRDEYVGFLDQIKADARNVVITKSEHAICQNIFSKKTGILLCSLERYIDDEEDEYHYYVYNMPLNEERREPKQIRKIVLQTKEEVQSFINLFNKLSGG